MSSLRCVSACVVVVDTTRCSARSNDALNSSIRLAALLKLSSVIFDRFSTLTRAASASSTCCFHVAISAIAEFEAFSRSLARAVDASKAVATRLISDMIV